MTGDWRDAFFQRPRGHSRCAHDMTRSGEKVVPNVVPGFTQPIQMRVEDLISGLRSTLALKLGSHWSAGSGSVGRLP